MNDLIQHSISGNSFLLSGNRCVFWEEEKALILSDLHLGKTGHFRKSGIAVPQTVFKEDMQRLIAQVQYFKPSSLIVVGDLFHSHANKELGLFLKWRSDFPGLLIHLVIGNHDILEKSWYQSAGIDCCHHSLKIGEFVFTHDISTHAKTSGPYIFSGHIHPSVKINGLGKQSFRLPCFYFGKEYAVLPAFGRFTGMHSIEPEKGSNVFALVNQKVMRV